MGIELIATDIDGTLLDRYNKLPAANLAALGAAAALGAQVALVTARKRSSTEGIARLLGRPCALITHNGARIEGWDGRELQHLRIPLAEARQIAAFADRRGIPLVVTIDEVNHFSADYPVADIGPDSRRVGSMVAAMVAAPTRIIAVGEAGIAALYGEFAGAADSLMIHRYYSRVGALRSAVITHPAADKGTALARLCRPPGLLRRPC